VLLVWVYNGTQKMLIPLFLLGLAGECFAKIYEDVSDLPGLVYDFVIVGGTTPFFREDEIRMLTADET
jgi:hypothetical protein